MNKKITDDAICYSDGRNSGIKISVTAQTDDTISFNIAFADYNDLKIWNPVTNADGTNAFASVDAYTTQAVTDGSNLYVLADNFSSSSVLRYDGSNWTNLGACATTSSAVSIETYNGDVYALVADYRAGNTVLKKYTSAGWQQIAAVNGVTANTPVLKAVNGALRL